MNARGALTTLLVAVAVVASSITARADQPATGDWIIRERADSTLIDLRFDYGEHNGFESHRVAAADVGLPRNELDSPGEHVTFTIVRDAGRLACEGWAGHGHGSGTFTFIANASYAVELGKRGITLGNPDRDILEAAIADLSFAYIDTIRGFYPHAEFLKLIELRAVGVDPDYVRTMEARFPGVDLQTMVSLRAVGVTDAYLDELKHLGFTALRAQEAVELRATGVNERYVKDLASVGYTDISAADLRQMRAVGVDSDFIRRAEAHGFHNLSVQRLIQARALGVF